MYEPEDDDLQRHDWRIARIQRRTRSWIFGLQSRPRLPERHTIATLVQLPPVTTPAFNVCPKYEGVSGSGLLLLELECDPTPSSPCTGMLPGEAGSAEVAPEPGEFAMLGLGIGLVCFFGWKRRQAMEPSRVNQENLAAC